MKRTIRSMVRTDTFKIIAVFVLGVSISFFLAWILETSGAWEVFTANVLNNRTVLNAVSIIISIGTIIFNLIHWIKG